MSKKGRPPPPMLDSVVMQNSSDELTSYEIQNNQALQLRAFLFQGGSVFSKDGKRDLGTITESEIDLSSKRCVGRGASGQVFVALLKESQKPIALKYIPITTKPHRDELERELTFFSARSDCPFVMQNLGAYWDAVDNAVVMPMEWMAYNLKDLASFWRGMLDETVLRDIAYQILSGLRYLHDVKRVIHRDLKPSNILIRDDGYVKIGDFGVSKLVQTLDISTSYIGTMSYMAPERLEQGSYSFTSDVWSLGLTLISTLRGGGNPWTAGGAEINLFQLLQSISGNGIPTLADTPSGRNFSSAANDFVARCLERSSDERLGAKELLEHPFFEGCAEDTAVENVRRVVEQMTRMISSGREKHLAEAKSRSEMSALVDEKIGRLDQL